MGSTWDNNNSHGSNLSRSSSQNSRWFLFGGGGSQESFSKYTIYRSEMDLKQSAENKLLRRKSSKEEREKNGSNNNNNNNGNGNGDGNGRSSLMKSNQSNMS